MTDKGKSPSLPSGDLRAILEQFNASHWRALELEFHGTKLFLSKDAGAAPTWVVRHSVDVSPPVDKAAARPASPAPALGTDHAATVVEAGEGQVIVKAPSLGTFYRSPKPGAAPFTQIGDQVEAETELCLIEVMKLFTTLRAGVKGKLVKILVDDGVMVEHDQPLFVIDTNG